MKTDQKIFYGWWIVVRTVLPPLMTARVLGQKHFAVIYGFLNVFTTLGTAVGVLLPGFIYDSTKSYHMAFALYIVLCLIAAAAGIAVLTRKKSYEHRQGHNNAGETLKRTIADRIFKFPDRNHSYGLYFLASFLPLHGICNRIFLLWNRQ